MEEVQIVVERVGYGSRKWRWRLANECGLTLGLGAGFSGPESAYASAQQRLHDLRNGAGSSWASTTTARVPVERKKRQELLAAPEFIPHFTRAKKLVQLGS